MQIFQWVQSHYVEIVNVLTALVAVASIIVKWTPTIKDDGWLLTVVKFLGKYIALNRNVPDDYIRQPEETVVPSV